MILKPLKCCIILGLILKSEFMKDDSQPFQLFDDAPFWALTDEGHDVRSSAHGSIACKASYGESKSCITETRKYVKQQKFECLTFFELNDNKIKIRIHSIRLILFS